MVTYKVNGRQTLKAKVRMTVGSLDGRKLTPHAWSPDTVVTLSSLLHLCLGELQLLTVPIETSL